MTETSDFPQRLHAVRFGLLLSALAIFAGFSLGGLFGSVEGRIKAGLLAKAEAVLDEHYDGDEDAARRVVSKAFTYHLRAHMHWGGIGAATLALGMLLALSGVPARAQTPVSLALGIGALLYPLAWLLAGRSAPGLGGTGAAKDAWELIFLGGAGLLLLGTAATIGLVGWRLLRGSRA